MYFIPGITKKPKTPENVMAACAEFYDVNAAFITYKDRTRKRVHIRQMVMKVMRDQMRFSYTQIAAVFGFDHSTAIHHIKQLNDYLCVYPEIQKEYESLIIHLNLRIDDLHFNRLCCPNCGHDLLVNR
jgi:chromosomal replication initiation ATPase DnaA